MSLFGGKRSGPKPARLVGGMLGFFDLAGVAVGDGQQRMDACVVRVVAEQSLVSCNSFLVIPLLNERPR